MSDEKLNQLMMERDALQADLASHLAAHSEAKERVAESIELMKNLRSWIDDYLKRHGQSRQQGAQVAEPEDECRKAAFENHWYAQKTTAFGSTEAQRHFDAGWQAHAALAIQSAGQGESGHGHVTPRADGFRARCGGPGMCAVCGIELEALRAKEDD